MTINEISGITSTSPKTPEQLRIVTLKRNKDLASKNLQVEKDRQKLAKAKSTISNLALKKI